MKKYTVEGTSVYVTENGKRELLCVATTIEIAIDICVEMQFVNELKKEVHEKQSPN